MAEPTTHNPFCSIDKPAPEAASLSERPVTEGAADERMAWSGTCDECLAVFVVYPHRDASESTAELIENGPDEWEGFTSCYVCDGTISWNGNDPIAAVIRNG